MPSFKLGEAAALLGVPADRVRKWVDEGRLRADRTAGGHRLVDGADLARLAQEIAAPPVSGAGSSQSARNRVTGLVTRVIKDTVMAQVDLQAGPYRMVSLMSREAAEELGLEPGVLATAVVKATAVVIEVEAS